MQGKFSGIAKFDLGAKNGGAVLGQIEHGPERYGGEAVFVKGSGRGECLLPCPSESEQSTVFALAPFSKQP